MKFNRNNMRKLILKEMAKMVGEDALINAEKDKYRNTGYNPNARSPHNLSLVKSTDSYSDFGGGSYCDECGGSNMWEGECMECGYSGGQMLKEDCGCGCPGCNKDKSGEDYSLDSMKGLASMVSGIMSGENQGFEIEFNGDEEYEEEDNEYMTQKHLHVISDLSQKLLDMIPQGYELEDWQRSHLSSIADDILELYYSLETDFHER